MVSCKDPDTATVAQLIGLVEQMTTSNPHRNLVRAVVFSRAFRRSCDAFPTGNNGLAEAGS